MKKTLRLLITKRCNRVCPGCCNNDWNLDNLPINVNLSDESIKDYDEIILTGGEPTLVMDRLLETVLFIRNNPNCKTIPIIVYSANVTKLRELMLLVYLRVIDGITFTIHEQADVEPFIEAWEDTLYQTLFFDRLDGKMRLNVFKGIIPPDGLSWRKSFLYMLDVKDNIEWIKNCPLPENETFMRLKDID